MIIFTCSPRSVCTAQALLWEQCSSGYSKLLL